MSEKQLKAIGGRMDGFNGSLTKLVISFIFLLLRVIIFFVFFYFLDQTNARGGEG